MTTIQKSEITKVGIEWRKAAIAALTGASLLAVGCSDYNSKVGEPRDSVAATFALQPAGSCDQVKTRLSDAIVEDILRMRYNEGGRWLEDAGNNNVNNSAPTADPQPAAPTDYTTTNVQEAGVDEADFVKTDGEHIYTLVDGDLVILKSWPAEQTSELGRLLIDDNSYPYAMFLKGDKVAVFGHVWDETPSATNPDDYFSGTRIAIIDVSDRQAPRLERHIDLEANYVDARMIDDDVYVVSQGGFKIPFDHWSIAWDENNGLPAIEYDADEARIEDLKRQARPMVRQLVQQGLATATVADMMPRERTLASDGSVVSTGALFDCTDIYLPSQTSQNGVLSITHFDIDTKSAIESTGLLANGWEVYASEDNLYVSLSSQNWWWGWGADDQETHIHKFALDGTNNEPRYASSGRVDGWLLNQFSMSEHNGFLRVATTENRWEENATTGEWESVGGNHLTILKDEPNGRMVETGSVRDLAPGEEIYSARFMGDRGFIVTFRQTDPLFSFDLSDPYNPLLKGELKINGFSSYMHPVGQNHLLTIGQDADADGRVLGVHLQFFDISDLTAPTRTFQQKISTGDWSSWSEAMWDHHAFTYHAGKKILAFPVNINDWDQNGGLNFSGLLIYNADPVTGFQEIGRVDHSDLAAAHYCASAFDWDRWVCAEEDYQWWTGLRRSIFIEDYVYSLSDVGLKVNDLLTPTNEHVALPLRQ